MALFNGMKINNKNYPNHSGEYRRVENFIYIKTKDERVAKLFNSLLDEKVVINTLNVWDDSSNTMLSGPFLIHIIDEDFENGTLIILKNQYN